MKSAKVVFGLLAALWGTACDKSSSNSIVVVTVTPAPSAPAVTRLRVVLTNRSSSDTVLFPQTNSGAPIKFNASFAVTFPKSRSGELDIAIDALDASSNAVASGGGSAVITVGGRVDVTIPLVDNGSADGGTPDSGLGEAGPGATETAAADTRTSQDAAGPEIPASRDAVGSGGILGTGGTIGSGGSTGTGGMLGAGGTTSGTGGGTSGTGGAAAGMGGVTTTLRDAGAGGIAGRDAGTGGVTGTGGVSGTGGSTVPRDAATTPSDAASSCFTTIVNNGYACGGAPACSACKVNGVSQEAECQKGIDCLAAAGPSCDSNCQLTCLNSAGSAQVGACIKALQTAACGGIGC